MKISLITTLFASLLVLAAVISVNVGSVDANGTKQFVFEQVDYNIDYPVLLGDAEAVRLLSYVELPKQPEGAALDVSGVVVEVLATARNSLTANAANLLSVSGKKANPIRGSPL